MNLHSTLMTLLNHPLQRIPIRRWSLALDTGEELAPRFKITLIKGITFGTYLEDDGIHAILLQFVQLLGEHRLNLLGRFTQILSVDTLDPGATEFTFVLCHQRSLKHQHHRQNQHP